MGVMSMTFNNVFNVQGNVVGQFQKNTAAVKKFGSQANSSMKQATAGANMLRGMLAPLAGLMSIALIKQFGSSAITAFKESEGAIANVEAGLQSTNNAIGMTSKQLSDMASSYQKNTIFEDDAILQNVTAQFLTFGNISSGVMDRSQKAALDVTAKLKGINSTGDDLKSTAIMMGKALEDPIRGMGAMRKVGISFNKSEEQSIKTMMAANNIMGAQNFMLAAIERQYGGTAAKLAGTDAGKIIQKQNEIGDSMENIGKNIIPIQAIFLTLKGAAIGAIAGIAEKFGVWYAVNKDVIDQGIDSFIQNIGNAFQVAAPYIQTAWDIFSGFAQTAFAVIQFLKPFAPIILSVVAAYQAFAIIQTVINGLTAAFNMIMMLNPVVLVIGLIIGAIVLLYLNWDTVVKFVTSTIQAIAGFFKNWYDVIILILGPIGLVTNAVIALFSRWGEVTAAFQSGGILGALQQIGRIVLDSIVSPIQKVLGLVAKIPGMGGFAANASNALTNMTGGKQPAPNAAQTEAMRANVGISIDKVPEGYTASKKVHQAPPTQYATLGVQ